MIPESFDYTDEGMIYRVMSGELTELFFANSSEYIDEGSTSDLSNKVDSIVNQINELRMKVDPDYACTKYLEWLDREYIKWVMTEERYEASLQSLEYYMPDDIMRKQVYLFLILGSEEYIQQRQQFMNPKLIDRYGKPALKYTKWDDDEEFRNLLMLYHDTGNHGLNIHPSSYKSVLPMNDIV